MPPAIIAALIGAGVTGTEMGLQASGAFQPSTTAATDKAQQTALAQQKAQEAQAFKQFAPDVQSTTGGALSNPAFAQMVAELAGQPGDIGLAQQTIFGNQPQPGQQPGTVFSGPGPGLASTVG